MIGEIVTCVAVLLCCAWLWELSRRTAEIAKRETRLMDVMETTLERINSCEQRLDANAEFASRLAATIDRVKDRGPDC